MKKITYILIIAISICFLGYSQTHYKREGKIIDILNNEISILDTTDNIWVWLDDTSTYSKGQTVIMSMHNNYTDENIYDDIIENIRVVQ
jgi:hypothetical protein